MKEKLALKATEPPMFKRESRQVKTKETEMALRRMSQPGLTLGMSKTAHIIPRGSTGEASLISSAPMESAATVCYALALKPYTYAWPN